MPIFAIVLTVASLSSIGLPGLNGFVGEFLCLKGAFDFDPWLCAVAALGTILGAVYMLSMLRRVLLGPTTRRENHQLSDVTGREAAAIALLLIPIVWIGVQPSFFVKPTEAAVNDLVRRIEQGKKVAMGTAIVEKVAVAKESTK